MRLSDLQNKDVVNIMDGRKIGNIIDININLEGKMEGLIVEKSRFLISMFSTKDEIEVKWNQIEKISVDKNKIMLYNHTIVERIQVKISIEF